MAVTYAERNEINNYRNLVECALSEVEARIQLYNLIHKNNNLYAIEHIKKRIKNEDSTKEKLRQKQLKYEKKNIEEHIYDFGGIRAILLYEAGVYALRDYIINQKDVILIEEKDYINRPKESGYQSLHLIIKIALDLNNQIEYIPIEIQLRTCIMDAFATIEHNEKYKKKYISKKKNEKLLNISKEFQRLEKELQKICNEN